MSDDSNIVFLQKTCSSTSGCRVEHPELIAERLIRFANLVGRDNVLASADCGFSSQALYDTEVHVTVVWEKFSNAARRGHRFDEAVEMIAASLHTWRMDAQLEE